MRPCQLSTGVVYLLPVLNMGPVLNVFLEKWNPKAFHVIACMQLAFQQVQLSIAGLYLVMLSHPPAVLLLVQTPVSWFYRVWT